MTSERIKEIQETTAYPQSVSVMLALNQVWNECAQERSYSEEEVLKLLIKFNQEIHEVEDVRGWFEQFKKK